MVAKVALMKVAAGTVVRSRRIAPKNSCTSWVVKGVVLELALVYLPGCRLKRKVMTIIWAAVSTAGAPDATVISMMCCRTQIGIGITLFRGGSAFL